MKRLILLLFLLFPVCLNAQKKDSLIINAIPPIGDGEPLYVLDNKVITKAEAEKIRSADVQDVSIIKKPGSVELYGEKGKNGVFMITSKNGIRPPNTLIVTKNSTFYLDSKKISNETAEKIDADTLAEVSLSGYPKGVLVNGVVRKDVVMLTSRGFAIRSYQEKFSAIDKAYDNYLNKLSHNDAQLIYVLDGKQLAKDKTEMVILFHIDKNKIASVKFVESKSPDNKTVTQFIITTKK